MNAAANGPSIELKCVCLTLGATLILDNISLSLNAGTVHAIVGPNGGGKSSLIKTILGQTPHQGEVVLSWPDQHELIAYAPQALEFDRSLPMTVMDFMAALCQRRPTFLGQSKKFKTQINAALHSVDMLGKAKRRMGDLSGGERQRVLLAQSLIPAAHLVILDEPMAALDKAGIDIFQSLLTNWRKQGTTVIWIDHDLKAVNQWADSLIGINKRVLFHLPASQPLAQEQLLSLFSNQG